MRRALLTGLVSFSGTALLLHLLFHLVFHLWPDARDEYSLVFVGTSFIHRQMIPRLFDEELQKLGIASRSFNLGMMGEEAGEAYFTLEQVLAKRPAKLRTVVLDAHFLDPDDANLSTWRYLTWHSPSATWDAAVERVGARHALVFAGVGIGLELRVGDQVARRAARVVDDGGELGGVGGLPVDEVDRVGTERVDDRHAEPVERLVAQGVRHHRGGGHALEPELDLRLRTRLGLFPSLFELETPSKPVRGAICVLRIHRR